MSLEDRAEELANDERRHIAQVTAREEQTRRESSTAIERAKALSLDFIDLCMKHGVSSKTYRVEGRPEREVWIVRPHHWRGIDIEVAGIAVDLAGNAHYYDVVEPPSAVGLLLPSEDDQRNDPYHELLFPPDISAWEKMVERMAAHIVAGNTPESLSNTTFLPTELPETSPEVHKGNSTDKTR